MPQRYGFNVYSPWAQIATPAAADYPDTGKQLIYPKSDGKWYTFDSAGVETLLGGGGVAPAPAAATYITQTANAGLSAEQALSSLATGLMQVTTATGVITSVTTSAGLAALISDETGTGALMFGTAPTITTRVSIPDGSVSDPAVQFTSDPNTGIYSVGADMLGLAAGGVKIAVANLNTTIRQFAVGDGTNGVQINLDGGVASRDVTWLTNAVQRWNFRVTSTAEAGSNAGSNFQIISRDDAGALAANVMTVTRSNGHVNFGASALATAHVRITGTADEVQLNVWANGTQTSDIQQWSNSSGTAQLKVSGTYLFFPLLVATASAPAYVKGGIYFDTTLNKLRVGGASAYETITSV